MVLHNVALFTSHFGAYERHIATTSLAEVGVPSFCFTDDFATTPTGFVSLPSSAPARLANPRLISRWHKVFGGRHLSQDFRYSIYVDAKVQIINADALFEMLDWFVDARANIAAWRHPDRVNWSQELRATVLRGGGMTHRLAELQLREYLQAGHQATTGLFETCVLLRDHAEPKTPALEDLWWDHIERLSPRDQVSLPIVAKHLGVAVLELPFPYRKRTYIPAIIRRSALLRALRTAGVKSPAAGRPFHENEVVRVWRH